MRKPIIAFDADDTILDFVPQWLHKFRQLSKEGVYPEHIKSWDIGSYVENKSILYNLLFSPRVYEGVLAFPSARTVIEYARTFARVIVVTSSYPLQNATPKLNCLATNGVIMDENDFILAKDKSLIRCDMFVDDNAENVESSSASYMSLLYNQPWNQTSMHPNRVYNWDNICEAIKEMKVAYGYA